MSSAVLVSGVCSCRHRPDGHHRYILYCRVCRVCGLNKGDCRGRGHTYERCGCTRFKEAA